MPALFEAAAAALEDGGQRRDMAPAIRGLLEAFDLGAEGTEVARGDAALLRVAARCGPLFRLPAPDAPGLVALGAEIDLAAAAGERAGSLPPASASGVGLTPRAALRSCLGEAAELLASVETAGDRARMRRAPPRRSVKDPSLDALLAALPWPEGRMRTGWLPARRLTDEAEVWVPREIALRGSPRRRAFAPAWPLSLGCGAGPTPARAALHGLLELIERDAVTLWSRGLILPRAVAPEEAAQARAAALLAQLRQGQAERRRSWLLDITSDLGVPVVAALSFAPDGSGFCCGFAARTGLAPAAEAAVLEMAQMELGHALVLAKARTRGEDALSLRDRAQRHRYEAVHAARCPWVHPMRPATAPDPALPPAETAPEAVLEALVRRLAARGLAPIRLDLTRPGSATGGICISVLRMLCPGLATIATTIAPARRSALATPPDGLLALDQIAPF